MSVKPIQFYDKKTCGTCKKAKSYLDGCQINYNVIDITKTPPSRDVLEQYIDEKRIKEFLNPRSTIYREKGFSKKLSTKAEAIDLMLHDPNLIKRPVIIHSDDVIFGFDKEKIDRLKKE